MSDYSEEVFVKEKKNPLDVFNSSKLVKICAPMVRYSKLPFRLLALQYGCDLVYTPMIVSDSFNKSLKARDSAFSTSKEDFPLIVQFAASNAEDFACGAETVVPFADGAGLNCGCPQRWAIQEGYGACLVEKPEVMCDMVRQARQRVPNDFSIDVKIRLCKHDRKQTVEVCRRAEKAGASWITIHGRTVYERGEPANHDIASLVKSAVSCPVVANGDICSLAGAERVQAATGIDGVMSANGILANPAMFAGYSETPVECLWDFVDLALSHGTSFTTLHHHVMMMLEHVLPKPHRRLFNSFTATTAVLDYLHEHFPPV